METQLKIYNTLNRKKEKFEPLNPPFVGMYVCGPTVYGKSHLGHARPAVVFDVFYRFLKHQGYKVRYVRNITDVGHLEGDADEGADKISKKARIEKLEPMEIVEFYTREYHRNLQKLKCLPPDIEPRATGHIMEQIAMIEDIINSGYAYISEGSVYFDVEKYSKSNYDTGESHNYGKLSGRVLDDLMNYTRELDGKNEKQSAYDFALWKKAAPEHLMRWKTIWSDGFPGWHLECSAMSTKYLGKQFDIHGGGLDLQFPHHECEIAQSVAANGLEPVKYWIHNNLITINGQKMSKSLNNFITLDELFSGNSELLEQAYSPMTIRMFMLQAHYRSTIDFSNEALKASEKGYKRLMAAMKRLNEIKTGTENEVNVDSISQRCYEALNDDMNTPIALAHLFDGVRTINSLAEGKVKIDAENLTALQNLYHTVIENILGLYDDSSPENNSNDNVLEGLMDMVIELRSESKKKKDYSTADKIRDRLKDIGIIVRDKKDGVEWEVEK